MHFAKTAARIALGVMTILPVAGAWALTPAQVNALEPTNIIYISGSTELDAALQAYAAADFFLAPGASFDGPLFEAGSYDIYKTATGYVLTGTAGLVGIQGLVNIAIVKQTLGGSAVGIHNVSAGIPVAGFPNLTNPAAFTATCGTPVTTPATGPFSTFNTYKCTLPESSTIVPNAGISDEAPTTWVGNGGVTAGDATALTTSNFADIPFAIIVNVALRNALQAAEGLTSGSETLANVPYLTSTQTRAILSGQMSSLGDLYEFNPSTGKATQIDPTGSFLHICRHGDTSGSELAANIYFFGRGCSKGSGVGGITAPDNVNTQAAGETWTGSAAQLSDLVFAGAGTNDVKNCVAAGTGSGDTFDARIGFVSTAQTSQGTNWRYIGLNGIAPTIWNIQLDKYDWLMTGALFTSTNASLALNNDSNTGMHSAILRTLEILVPIELITLNFPTQSSAASADNTGASDTGLMTGNTQVLYGSDDPNGPSAPAWPIAIRGGSGSIPTAGQGPNNPQSQQYPSLQLNGCNAFYQADPFG